MLRVGDQVRLKHTVRFNMVRLAKDARAKVTWVSSYDDDCVTDIRVEYKLSDLTFELDCTSQDVEPI